MVYRVHLDISLYWHYNVAFYQQPSNQVTVIHIYVQAEYYIQSGIYIRMYYVCVDMFLCAYVYMYTKYLAHCQSSIPSTRFLLQLIIICNLCVSMYVQYVHCTCSRHAVCGCIVYTWESSGMVTCDSYGSRSSHVHVPQKLTQTHKHTETYNCSTHTTIWCLYVSVQWLRWRMCM